MKMSQTNITSQAGISFVDQAFLSVFNFALGVLLIKNVGQDEYGMYVFATSMVLLVVGFQGALITTQLTVVAPRKPFDEQKSFCAALSVGQYLYWMPAAVVASGLFFALHRVDVVSYEYLQILNICIFSSLGTLTREFMRAYFFFKLKPVSVLMIDVAYLLVVACFVGVAILNDSEMLHLYILASLGLASLLVSVCGICRLNRNSGLSKERVFLVLHECWGNGKWALLGVVVTWLQTQSYVYLITSILGADQMAVTHAGRMLLMPVALLAMSYSKIFRAKWAHDWHNEKKDSVFSSARTALVVLVAITFIYSSGIYFLKSDLISVLFREEYQQAGFFIPLWCLIFVLQMASNNSNLLLQVFEEFKFLTVVNAATAIVTIASGLFLIENCGVKGGLWSMVVGEFLLALLLSLKVRRCRRLTF